MDVENRESSFYFKDSQMQFNHDIRVWVCGAEVTTHLRGSLSIRRANRESPSTLNFDLDNVKDVFTITASNKGYIEKEDGTYEKDNNPKSIPMDDNLSEGLKKKLNAIYDEIESAQSELQSLEFNHENALENIENSYKEKIDSISAQKIQAEQKKQDTKSYDKKLVEAQNKKDSLVTKENNKYESEKAKLEKKIQVNKSRLDKINVQVSKEGDSYHYSSVGSFGSNDNLGSTTGKSTDVTKEKKKGKKEGKTTIKSEEVIFKTDESLKNEEGYSDAAKKLIYSNKTILNANINVGNFLKDTGLGFNPYDLNIDTCIIEKNDPVRVFIKDPSRPFLTSDLNTTEDKYWIPMFTGFVDTVSEHIDYINGEKFLSIACYDIRGIMQKLRVQTNPRISRGTDTARDRANASKKLDVNTGYFTDFFAQGGLWGESSTKYLNSAFDNVCLEFLTGRWYAYNGFLDSYLGKVVSSQSNEILDNTQMMEEINKATKEKGTEPSLNGVGAFLPGIVIELPRYDEKPKKCEKTLELWHDILLFGVKATHYTASEMEMIGTSTLPYGLFDPYNCFVHMLTPTNGTEAKRLFDSHLEDLPSNLEYTSRFEFLTQLTERLDYQWFTNTMGDIVIEFPMYDFEPDVFGNYKDQLKVNNHLNGCVINETAGTIYSAVSATGGIQSINGNAAAAIAFTATAFAKSDQLAYKYGINIEEYPVPSMQTLTDPKKLQKQAVIELVKSNVLVSSMEMEIAYRYALFPNKPIYNVAKHRMATITGFAYNININSGVSCTVDTSMVRKLNSNNKFINIFNSPNTPVKYLGNGDIELSDASLSGIDAFYIDETNNKPVKELKKKK